MSNRGSGLLDALGLFVRTLRHLLAGAGNAVGSLTRLISELVIHKGKVMTHKMLLQQVWGIEYGEEVDYLRVFVNRLRHKLQDNSSNPKYIRTETDVGYRFIVEQLQQANATTKATSQSTALSG